MKLDAVKFKLSLGLSGVQGARLMSVDCNENAIEISYLGSENVFGPVEVVTEFRENHS